MIKRSRAEWTAVLEEASAGHIPAQGKAQAYDTACHMMQWYSDLGLWRDGSRILDVGSGNGRLAIPLTEREVTYVGLEPIPDCVDYSRRVFEPWPHIRFEHIDVRNELYWPEGAVDPIDLVFPLEDASIDFVIFSSVLTHVERLDVAAHYLDEARRVLAPGGRIWATWFRSPPNAETSADPMRTVFLEKDIMRLVRGFDVEMTAGGFTEGLHDQWQMVLLEPEA